MPRGRPARRRNRPCRARPWVGAVAPLAARRASATASRHGAASQASAPLRRRPLTRMVSSAMPSCGTMRDSSPWRVPSHTTFSLRPRKARATASAGNTCPPVPPAMISTGAAFMRPPSAPRPRDARDAGRPSAVLEIDAQQKPEADQRHEDAAAAVTHQRQRQALGGQDAHVHADVDERPARPARWRSRRRRRPGTSARLRPRPGRWRARARRSRRRARSATTLPARPNSSAITANTKSVWASGR